MASEVQSEAASRFRARPAAFAHPTWLPDLSPALSDGPSAAALLAHPRVGGRAARTLSVRIAGADLGGIDLAADGRDFLIADAAQFEQRLLFVGAVSNGPAVRHAVSRLAVRSLVLTLGEPILRAAVRAGALGQEADPLDASSPEIVRARIARSAARHLAAWLGRQPEPLRRRALLGLAPDGDLVPREPAAGDPDFIPTLAPLVRRLEDETDADGDAQDAA